MNPEKRDQTNFSQLVDEVEPLAPSPRRAQGPAVGRALRRSTKPRAVFTVKQFGELIIGYASDRSERFARALAPTARSLDDDNPRLPRRLDLHRATVAQAVQRLATALRAARADGLQLLVVVVGKGKHSAAAGPVLPNAVIEYLSGPLASSVLAFRSAPPELGGSGALLVRLRPKSRP